MKITSFFLLIAIAVSSSAYSEETQSELQSTEISKHHRIYFGPDFFGYRKNNEVPADEQTFGIKESETCFFGGIKLGYDFVKPRTVYFGADGQAALGSITKRQTASTVTYSMPEEVINAEAQISNLEVRYGYSFSGPFTKSTLSPFVGLGGYVVSFPAFRWTDIWIYNAVGFRANHQFQKSFDAGLNLKGMYTFANNFSHKTENTWGYEVALPFTWHIGKAQKWDVQVQPYVSKILPNIPTFFGARLLAGYNF
jgi:hypothetical protein